MNALTMQNLTLSIAVALLSRGDYNCQDANSANFQSTIGLSSNTSIVGFAVSVGIHCRRDGIEQNFFVNRLLQICGGAGG
jgi:hypothetical protein